MAENFIWDRKSCVDCEFMKYVYICEQLFKKPERLLDIAGPVADSSQSVVSKKKDLGSLRLVKL